MGDAFGFESFHGLAGVGFGPVGDGHAPQVAVVEGGQHRGFGRRVELRRVFDAPLAEQPGVAGEGLSLRQTAAHAPSRMLGRVGSPRHGDAPIFGVPHHCPGDGVGAAAFEGRKGLEQFPLRNLRRGVHLPHLEGPFGERTRLVEKDGAEPGDHVQEVAALKQNPLPRGGADAAEIAERDADHQCARARDHQKNESPVDRFAPGKRELRIDERPEPGSRGDDCGKQRHHGGVDAGEAADEPFGGGFAVGSLLDQAENAGQCAVGERAGGAHAHGAVFRDHPRKYVFTPADAPGTLSPVRAEVLNDASASSSTPSSGTRSPARISISEPTATRSGAMASVRSPPTRLAVRGRTSSSAPMLRRARPTAAPEKSHPPYRRASRPPLRGTPRCRTHRWRPGSSA